MKKQIKYEKIWKLNNEKFRRKTGIRKDTFSFLKNILEDKLKEKIERKKEIGGRPNKLTLEDRLLLTIEYWRDYKTYFDLSIDYNISESNTCNIVKEIENILIKSNKLNLKKDIFENFNEDNITIVDVTEIRIQRPKKKQRKWYSGKKKIHTSKVQAIVNKEDRRVLSIFSTKGTVHDFKIFKISQNKIKKILDKSKLLADSGYQGIKNLIDNVEIPFKKRKNQSLSPEEKKFNRKLSSVRIIIENVFSVLKRFKIFSTIYRNRRKRLNLRFNLISGIYNYELDKNI